MGYLSLHSSCIYDNELGVVFGVFIDIDCNKCGQTSRPVVRAKIQTSCDFEANVRSSIRFLACFHLCFNNALLGLP